MTRRRKALLLLGLLLGASWGLSQGLSLRHSLSVQESCAKTLGIAYTPEEGATERLTAFQTCVLQKQ